MQESGGDSATAWRRVASAVRETIQAASSFATQESQLCSLVQQMPISIALFDRNMRYLAASKGWQKDYGLEVDLVGRSHYEVFPDMPERWKALHKRGLSGEILRETHDLFVRADGRTHVEQWEIWPWWWAEQVAGIFIASEPLTWNYEPRGSESEIAQALARLGIWRLDTNCRRVFMSAEMQRIFGRPENVLSFTDFLAAVHPSDRQRVETCWRAALEGRPYDIEYRISADGIEKVICARAYLRFGPEGEPVGGIGIVQDITERRAELGAAFRPSDSHGEIAGHFEASPRTHLGEPKDEPLIGIEHLLLSMDRMRNSLVTLKNTAAVPASTMDEFPLSEFKRAAQLLGAKATAVARDALLLCATIERAARRRSKRLN